MRAYEFHPEAEGDLNDIWEYLAEDNPEAADRTIDKIVAAIDALVPFPNQGHRRPDLTSRPLRFISVDNYLVAYAPDKKPLWILAVMHGRRNPRIMAAILRGRE
jgi:plasmid stabilization system protein ParE